MKFHQIKAYPDERVVPWDERLYPCYIVFKCSDNESSCGLNGVIQGIFLADQDGEEDMLDCLIADIAEEIAEEAGTEYYSVRASLALRKRLKYGATWCRRQELRLCEVVEHFEAYPYWYRIVSDYIPGRIIKQIVDEDGSIIDPLSVSTASAQIQAEKPNAWKSRNKKEK